MKKLNLPKKIKTSQSNKQTCITCKVDRVFGSFYTTTSPLYSETGRFPVCKSCIQDGLPYYDSNDISELHRVVQDREYVTEVRRILNELNKPFVLKLWQSSIEESEKSKKNVFGLYMKNINFQGNGKMHITIEDGDNTLTVEDIIRMSLQSETDISKPNSEDNNDLETVTIKEDKMISKKGKKRFSYNESDFEITKEDIVVQKDCIKILGYDPFEGFSERDRKTMYQELHTFLDEDTQEDQHLISIIIQLVNNNNQIRKIDLIINEMSATKEELRVNAVEIGKLTATKKQIAETSDKLAKENSIAAKHRADKKQGRSTLGYMMKELRQLNFEDAEQDYYNMKRSYGLQVTAEISTKAIFDQLNFDENDREDMLKEQAILINALRTEKEELEEKLRIANIALSKKKVKEE